MAYIDQDLYTILGEHLRDARDNANMTLSDAASKMGVSTMTIQRYEKAERKATVETVQKLCSIYDVNPDDLMQHSIERFRSMSSTIGIDGLSEKEHFLISHFRSLDSVGQEKLLDYASDLAASGRYTK